MNPLSVLVFLGSRKALMSFGTKYSVQNTNKHHHDHFLTVIQNDDNVAFQIRGDLTVAFRGGSDSNGAYSLTRP